MISLIVGTQPSSGATLGCTINPVTATSGVASFVGCEIVGKTGTYTLTATSPGLSSGNSGAFTITVGAAAQVAFTTQPGGGANTTVWTTQPKVAVEDSGGNTVTSGSSSVTLAVAEKPAAPWSAPPTLLRPQPASLLSQVQHHRYCRHVLVERCCPRPDKRYEFDLHHHSRSGLAGRLLDPARGGW